FEVNGGSSEPGPESRSVGQLASFTERFAGSINAGQGAVDIPLGVRLPALDAKLNYHPANERLVLQLVDQNNRVVAESSDKSLTVANLAEGRYTLRVAGSPSRPVDFVIKGRQASL
ncbi:MAG TPA: hypothetical protein VJQ56_00440, partial [Blastocatellia bacterium]|nr:hypothetical protein [Blastocatellia bacterium]